MGILLVDTVHVVVLTFGFIIIILAQPGYSLFSFHPSLMSLGLMIFALEGIVQLKDPRVPVKYRITIHWVMQSIGMGLALIAFYAIYYNKMQLNKPHYVTWHGLCGITTISLLTIQWIGGWTTKYPIGLSQLGIKRRLILKAHKASGVVASMGIALTVFLSLYSTWFTNLVPSSTAWWIMFVLLAYPRFFFLARKIRGTDPWI